MRRTLPALTDLQQQRLWRLATERENLPDFMGHGLSVSMFRLVRTARLLRNMFDGSPSSVRRHPNHSVETALNHHAAGVREHREQSAATPTLAGVDRRRPLTFRLGSR